MYFGKECKTYLFYMENLKADIWKNCNSKKLSVFSENEIRECEDVVEMIKELSKGINRFNEDELLEILAYISST